MGGGEVGCGPWVVVGKADKKDQGKSTQGRTRFNLKLQTTNTRIPCSLYIRKQEPRHKHILATNLFAKTRAIPTYAQFREKATFRLKPTLLLFALQRTRIFPTTNFRLSFFSYQLSKLDKKCIPRLKVFF